MREVQFLREWRGNPIGRRTSALGGGVIDILVQRGIVRVVNAVTPEPVATVPIVSVPTRGSYQERRNRGRSAVSG